MIIGYTTGVFDLFHIGHLNLLRGAKALCGILIVGVSTDELVFQYKKKLPVIPFEERIEIVRSISYVDCAVRREIRDKVKEWEQLKFDVAFVGNDWWGNGEWIQWAQKLRGAGVGIVYLPHTPNRSTTEIIESIRGEAK